MTRKRKWPSLAYKAYPRLNAREEQVIREFLLEHPHTELGAAVAKLIDTDKQMSVLHTVAAD